MTIPLKRAPSSAVPPGALWAWCRAKAAQMGEAVRDVVESLLEDHLLHHLRQVHGILRLGDKYGASRLNAACRRALAYSDPRYRTIKAILEKGLDGQAAPATLAPVLAGAFLRGPEELFASTVRIEEVFHDQGPSPDQQA